MNKKVICLMMIAVMSIGTALGVCAETVKVSEKGINVLEETYAMINTKTTSSVVMPIFESQAEHRPIKGATTTISVSKAVTKTSTESASISAKYSLFVLQGDLTLGLSSSVSNTVTTSISYQLGTNNKAGRYRIETVFPGRTVTYDMYKQTGAKTVKIYSKTISYKPRKNDSYKRLKRYADL